MHDALILPKGYGFRRPAPDEIRAHRGMDCCLLFETPRKRGPRRYVIGADVADGLGQDRSVACVVRAGTIESPAEQVAEYTSDAVTPANFAYILQALGEYYKDEDGVPAKVAIECNNHGLATQDLLQMHLGYGHFYIWEYHDAADPSRRYTTRIGWYTTPRTRPLLLSKFHDAVVTTDPVSGASDFILHSPALLDELQDFQTEGALWEAAAARGAHDDRVIAAAIAYYVAWRLQAGETEPLEDRRRRRAESLARQSAAAATPQKPDWRNTPCTTDEVDAWGVGVSTADKDDLDMLLYDPHGGLP